MTEAKQPITGLYCDLDGVLVDFVKLAKTHVPTFADEEDPKASKKAEGKLWSIVGRRTKEGKGFWSHMDPMKDMAELWSYIKDKGVEILSATGSVGTPDPEKREWCKRHLGEVKVNLVKTAKEKASFARPGAVLIDDKMKAITPWRDAGGIGILHTSAAETIRQLKELGL